MSAREPMRSGESVHPPLDDAGGVARRDVRTSLWLLAGVLALTLVGLALQGNWPKVLRVGVAAAAYGSVLTLAARRATPRYAAFAAAGAAAGLLSGVVRADVDPRVVLVQTVAGSLLLGGVHWLALRSWRRVRREVAVD